MLAWKERYPQLPEPSREVLFHPTRKWRFDFAWMEYRLAVEIQGGGWGGRHSHPYHQSRDFEKLREAIRLGWRVLQYNVVDFGSSNSGKIWDVVDDIASFLINATPIE